MLTDLEHLSTGASATVVTFDGGAGVYRKLDAIGLRPGKVVQKLSSQFMAGPVTVIVDGRQLAMGRGIARKIRVEVKK